MPYTVTTTVFPEVHILSPKVFGDQRGYFFESFNKKDLQKATGLDVEFVQDNHSRSVKGVLRGLHYQLQHPQGKLVRVTHGTVYDVIVDIRRSSSNFGKWFGLELSAENKLQLWFPEGFAHGFLVTSESAEFIYKTTDYWYPEYEHSLHWNDPEIGIHWPLDIQPIISAKDESASALELIETFE